MWFFLNKKKEHKKMFVDVSTTPKKVVPRQSNFQHKEATTTTTTTKQQQQRHTYFFRHGFDRAFPGMAQTIVQITVARYNFIVRRSLQCRMVQGRAVGHLCLYLRHCVRVATEKKKNIRKTTHQSVYTKYGKHCQRLSHLDTLPF